MQSMIIFTLILCLLGTAYMETLCTSSNKDLVARLVYGEARGESERGQLAVAYTVVNRVSHEAYPSTVLGVYSQKVPGTTNHQYSTLDVTSHTLAFNHAQSANNTEYRNAMKAATDALCGLKTDPTTCAVNYCAYDPCSATDSNRYWTAYNKVHIGHHYFVCLKRAH